MKRQTEIHICQNDYITIHFVGDIHFAWNWYGDAEIIKEKLCTHTHTPAHPPEAQQRIDAAHDVIEAAMNWWMMKRPLEYSERQHLKNPKINCLTRQEDALAEAIALLQAGRK